MGPWSKRLRSTAILLALVALLAACLPGGDQEAGGGDQDAGGDQETGGATAGTDATEEVVDDDGQTLVVWDQWARGVEGDVVDQLNAEFSDEHGVTVQRETKTLDDLNATIGLAMGQADGPDVAQVNQGRADMGALVEAGLLMDLSASAEERGWTERFSENLLNRNMFSEDGAQFGTGNLYGIAPQAEVVGWYYNKATFDELGLDVPATFDELAALLPQIAEAGETPITFGNLDAWPAIHTYGAVEHVFVDTGYLNDFIFNLGDAGFDRPENVEAAEIVQTWVDEGYFTENFEGIGYDDSWAQFAAGEGALMLTGSWISGELDQDSYGFFLTPGETAGDVVPQIGGQGVPLAVRADTEVGDVAIDYLDWMVSERAAQLWAEAGLLPSGEPPDGAVADQTLLADIVGGWQTTLEADQVGHYLDWATPTFYDTLTAELQLLLSGSVEPQAFVDTLEQDYRSTGG
jgi:raffinose/stachyose/melibiose transport system substrate-binding protein